MKIGNLDIEKIILGDVEIPKAYLGEDVVYESGGGNPYENQYLTFIAGEGGAELFLHPTNASVEKNIEISQDGEYWTQITTSTFPVPFSLQEGDKMMFRGLNDSYADSSYYNTFSGTTGNLTIEGNIMSLIYGEDFIGQKTFPEGTSYNFKYLFRYISAATMNVENLVLPVTALTDYCYQGMFQGCRSLTTAPALPATTLAQSCYANMFNGCTSLTTAPVLPATTLAIQCYNGMFYGCTSLTTAPELSATTMAASACTSMFQNCSGLTTAPSILPATTLADYCYYRMFYGCRSLATVPALPATTLAVACYREMFQENSGITSIDNLELPATVLADDCYRSMFYKCSGLTSADIVLPATALTSSCYKYMFAECAALTTVPELPATTLTNNCYEMMFYNCHSLNYIKCLATDISASSCTKTWVTGVAASGTFVKDASMTGWTTGTSGIPNNWTVIDA